MAMAYPQNRQDRLAQALRDNLKKRKEQARERALEQAQELPLPESPQKTEDKGVDNA